ncbi:MAG: O-antigen ligase family protein [Pirellulales bacterium]|nr:O-antigen ligase family protein [Pirellulales bacterium]
MSRSTRKPKTAPPPAEGDGRPVVPLTARIRPGLLAGTVVVFVARPLLPSEAVAQTGEGVPLAMAALVLAAIWLAAVAAEAVRARSRLGGEAKGDSPLFAARRSGQSPARRSGQSPAIRFGATDAAVLVFLAFLGVSAGWAVWHEYARPAWNVLWQWIGLGAGYFLLRQLVRAAREVRAIVAAMIALGVALAALGLWQYGYENPILRAQYARDPDAMLRANGLWYPPDSPLREQFANRLASVEPSATFALTNSLAGFLAPWLAVLLAVVASGGTAGLPSNVESTAGQASSTTCHAKHCWPSQQWRPAWAFGPALAATVMAACLVLTKSRSAYAAMAVGAVLIAPHARSGRRLGWKLPAAALAALAVLVGVAVAVGGLDAAVLGEATKSLGYRVEYWRSTLAMIRDHPVLGCGPGQFQDFYTAYKLPQASEEVADPHNFLLEIGATAGTPAMLAFLAVLGGFAWTLARRQTSAASDERNASSTGGDAAAWVLGAAALGILAAWPLGVLDGTWPDPALAWLSMPTAAATVWLLRGWIEQGRFSSGVAAIGLVVLLVNLLAAGGIAFPGVAGSFWILLALGLAGQAVPDKAPGAAAGLSSSARDMVGSINDSGHTTTRLHSLSAVGGALVFVLLVVLCYWTGYAPVLAAQGHVAAALAYPPEAEAHFRAAAEADPLWAEPWNQLASSAFARWQQSRRSEDLKQFEACTDPSLRLARRASPTWAVTGDRYFEIFEHNASAETLDDAIHAYRQANDLYPTNATYRAKLAIALRAKGDRDGFEREKAAALDLDAVTPHRDKKLPPALRVRLLGDTL